MRAKNLFPAPLPFLIFLSLFLSHCVQPSHLKKKNHVLDDGEDSSPDDTSGQVLDRSLQDVKSLVGEGLYENKYTLMWVSAHPDDELWGAATAFARYCKVNKEKCIYVYVTDGSTGSYVNTNPTPLFHYGMLRRDEGICSADRIDGEVRFLGMNDGGLNASNAVKLELEKRLVRTIRETQPDIIITHGVGGEYGHSDHITTSNVMDQAVVKAASANSYAEQLGSGLSVWDTPKYYHIKYDGYPTSEPLTLHIPGDEFSSSLGQTYGAYAKKALEDCHVSQLHALAAYPVAQYTKLSLIRKKAGINVANPEMSLLDGLNRSQKVPYVREWITIGPFADSGSNLSSDKLTEDGGEANIIPTNGMVTGGLTWHEQEFARDYVNFRSMFSQNNANAVGYAYKDVYSSSAKSVQMKLFGHDRVKVWLNGSLVYSNLTPKEYFYEDSVPLNLVAGYNRLLIKVGVGSKITSVEPDGRYVGEIARPWGFFAKFPTEIRNIAFNKPATAQSTEDAGHAANKANDADSSNNSYWSASSSPQWWQVDLEDFYDLTGVMIRTYVDGSRFYRYSIAISVDGSNWTQVAQKTDSVVSTDSGDAYAVTGVARYIRVNMLSNSAGVGVQLSDFKAYGTKHVGAVMLENIALNKPATAESDEGSSYAASRANDSDSSNGSIWGGSPSPRWWQVDLQDVYQLSGVAIRNYVDGSRFYQYNIQISVDGTNWTQVAQKKDSSIATTAGDTYLISGLGRYIRVNMLSNSANSGVHISDFKAFGVKQGSGSSGGSGGSSGGGGGGVRENLALNKTATAQSDERIFYAASMAVDSNLNSYWGANPYPRWWQVDLGAVYSLNEIVIRHYVDGSRFYRYNIEISSDQVTWTRVVEKMDSRIASEAGDSYPVSGRARYVRVNMTFNSANAGVHISDFKVFGQ